MPAHRSLVISVATVCAALVVGVAVPPVAQSVAVLPNEPDRRCAWPIVYPKGANYAWPDTNAAYINQAVMIGPNEKVVIQGRDPKARYWSITTYNYEDREVIDRVNDVTVKRAKNGSWTVTVSPKDKPKDPNSLQAAPVVAPGQQGSFKNVTVIMYRVYLSETSTYTGGVLPTVTLYHDDGAKGLRSERLKPCVGEQIRPPDTQPILETASGVPSDYFVRAPGGKFYPSFDTSYLAAQVPYDPATILVVRGKAPAVTKDVRYWSICQNVNALPLPVVDCASDEEITLTKGNYTVAIVGPGQVPDEKAYPGVTFLQWAEPGASAPLPDAFLIVRNILPSKSFKYGIDKVTLGDPASPTMGAYAPIIEHVALADLAAR